MTKDLEILKKENEKIREEMKNITGMNYILWEKIEKLINNEIEQEKLCGE